MVPGTKGESAPLGLEQSKILWDHLKNSKSLYPLSAEQQKALIDLQHNSFEKSDAIMSKCISTAISLAWTEDQVHEKGARLFLVLQQALS
jgi:8-amino-3,8-dideoxy-alpha-D-manno-octulosonate transaminase